MVLLFVFVFIGMLFTPMSCWNDGGVLLRDVQVLTLYRGRYTTARRSSPIPQLQCVGGSAGCSSFVPEVVQCQNKGWDGVDVQWECKADMDNHYRFGKVEVSCEGYNSRDDPYVLSGSCGLEYTLELTGQGRQNQGGSGFFDFSGKQQHGQNSKMGEDLGGLVIVVFLLLLAFLVYKMFLCDSGRGSPGDGYGRYQGPDGPGVSPPPPGFRSEYTDPPPAYSYYNTYSGANACGGSGFGGLGGGVGGLGGGVGGLGGGLGGRNRGGGGGFWTGMGTGGLLGYLLGSQRRGPPVSPAAPQHHYTNHTSNTSNTSTGTRTASGFGVTKRR